MRIAEIHLHRIELPLTRPYKVSSKEILVFDPLVAEIRDIDGRSGWGEALISKGYGIETAEGGWAFCNSRAEAMVGLSVTEAKRLLMRDIEQQPQATSLLFTALEMLEGSPLLQVAAETRVPLLEPVHAFTLEEIPAEVEHLLEQGFRTLKVKVGFDPEADLARVAAIQAAVAGRAALRLDANQGFTREQGCRFASALDPAGIQLFEQPCAMEDWAANAAVAAVSRVPVMLDESIYSIADIERAATIPGVGFVKLKLKKLGSLERLEEGLKRIRAFGMNPVLGDGVATEIGCWLEGCVARTTVTNAGEMNGWLKPSARLFADPLPIVDGAMVLRPGPMPAVDPATLSAHTREQRRHAATRITVPAG